MTNANELKKHILDVPDFPINGVTFRDITPLLSQKFSKTIDALLALFSDEEIEETFAFAGLDARGFIFASALAERTCKNLVVIRKSGKLPPPIVSEEYDLEYGSAKIDMKPGDGNIILVDDVIATGGSMLAGADLCREAGYNILAIAALIDLTFLNDFEWSGHKARSVVQYDS